MEINSPEIQKLIKMFCVIGLDETKITKYNAEEIYVRFVQDIDIIKKQMKISGQGVENENEKW